MRHCAKRPSRVDAAVLDLLFSLPVRAHSDRALATHARLPEGKSVATHISDCREHCPPGWNIKCDRGGPHGTTFYQAIQTSPTTEPVREAAKTPVLFLAGALKSP